MVDDLVEYAGVGATNVAIKHDPEESAFNPRIAIHLNDNP